MLKTLVRFLQHKTRLKGEVPNIFTSCFIAAARASVDTFFSESRPPRYAEQRASTKRQSVQYGDETRHQKRSALSQRQFRNSQLSGFQYKDNFEFSSDWNHTDSGLYGVLSESVTEMTDAKMQELGFPVQTSTNPDPTSFHKSSSSERQNNLPAPSVIDKHSQFFQLMSRKYQLSFYSQTVQNITRL